MLNNISRFMLIAVLTVGILNISGSGFTEDKKDDGIVKQVTVKKLTGEVTGVSPTFIAILYGVDEKIGTSYEMALYIDKGVTIENKKDLKEISNGDIVTVTYEETIEKNKEGKERLANRVVKKIVFIKKGTENY